MDRRPPARLAILAFAVALLGCRSPRLPSGEGPSSGASAPAPGAVRHVTIDLLALDLTTCGRCTGTEAHLDAVLAKVTERLRAEGASVEVRKTIVRTAEEARAVRLVSSPTIRVDGRDIAMELRESECKECGDLCTGSESVLCRVWVWRGREYVEAPEEMIVEGVLRAFREGPAPTVSGPFVLPANLERFFESRAKPRAPAPWSPDPECCPGAGEPPK